MEGTLESEKVETTTSTRTESSTDFLIRVPARLGGSFPPVSDVLIRALRA
jgi:hypothetical protein